MQDEAAKLTRADIVEVVACYCNNIQYKDKGNQLTKTIVSLSNSTKLKEVPEAGVGTTAKAKSKGWTWTTVTLSCQNTGDFVFFL